MSVRAWSLPFVLLAISLATTGPTSAGERATDRERDTVQLDELTWTELRDRIAAGQTSIIVPIGGTEQSGPALALGKHNVRVRILSDRIARVLGNALVAPVLAYVPEGRIDPPTGHMRFPGTITIPESAFEAVLDSAARSFKRAGFRDVLFLGDHGGYQAAMKAVADRLNREWAASPVRAHAVEQYYRATETAYVQALKRRGFRDDEIGLHAGLADTALTLALDPALVRTDRLASVRSGTDGVAGDPRRADAELGKLGVDAVVAETVAAVRQAVARR
jgi:creatinine amidohydrolase/Fe(II)-dependent formamide hydrolase-like protein